jgi:dolichol-phosphate mannosyltransferase
MLDRLGKLVISRGTLSVLVVDDNSPDGTGDIAAAHSTKHPNIHLLRREGKSGLGAAYLAGFRYALDAGADVVVTMDCDFSHEPEALPFLVDELEGFGCVVGSRYVDGGRIENWPKRRKILSAIANRFVQLLFVMPVLDCTSGYRLYTRRVIENILSTGPRSQGYSFQVEALRIALAGPAPVREFPILFVERTHGDSKMGVREIVSGVWNLAILRGRLLFEGRSPLNKEADQDVDVYGRGGPN